MTCLAHELSPRRRSGSSTARFCPCHLRGRVGALKELTGTVSRQRAFQRELSILSAGRHENIVAFRGKFTGSERLALIQHLCPGGDLFCAIYSAQVSPSSTQKLKMLSDVAEAMGYMHSQAPQVIHRDLKSMNILLMQPLREGSQVQLKVADFGSARAKEPDHKGNWQAMTKCVGSVNWTAPEVFSGNYDEKADVYSYAMVMFEILCLEIPFENEDPSKIYEMTRRGVRPDWASVPRSIPDVVADLMVGCWGHLPAGRPGFSTIRELIPARKL
mmetsp:Transcript_48053/g.104646  ORF Transcript_48053/g.104646 Transcript_48053/m.104646 type:complete len:273 (+) Transcript_48053:94-912(+)